MFELCRRVFCRRPGQQILRRLADHELATRRRKNRHQADFDLLSSDLIPRYPDAITGTELRFAEVLGELLGCKGIFAVGSLTFGAMLTIVIAIDDQLSLDRHGFIRGIVEVDSPAKPARRLLAGRIEHRRRPDHC